MNAAKQRDGFAERRREPRVVLRSAGTIDLGDHTVPCQTLDVSSKGLALLATIWPPRRSVRIRFRLGDDDAGWTDVEGRAVRCSAWGESGRLVWGLVLHPMDLGTRTRLRDYLLRH